MSQQHPHALRDARLLAALAEAEAGVVRAQGRLSVATIRRNALLLEAVQRGLDLPDANDPSQSTGETP